MRMCPLWERDSESTEGKKGPEERVRQRGKSELNELEEEHMNCGRGIKEGSVKRTKSS